MKSFAEQIAALSEAGYRTAEAQSKVAHDAILLAMYKSGFKKNCTVKGGVVMCELTKDIRRTTMDLDVDFVRYSISEATIRRVVARWARLTGFKITIFGTILELRQDDYRGRRVYLDISDGSIRKPVRTKDVFDLHYLSGIVNQRRLKQSVDSLILHNPRCPLRNSARIIDAISKTFGSKRFLRDMASPKSNWLGLPPHKVVSDVLACVKRILRA